MPTISLDNEVIFDSNKLRNPKIQRQKPDMLCEDAQISQPRHLMAPNNDAILISSDDESGYDNSASVQSNSSLPSINQLLADRQECGYIVDVDDRGT